MSRRQSAGDVEPAAARAGSRARRWSLADLFSKPKQPEQAPDDPAPQAKQRQPVLTRRRSSPEAPVARSASGRAPAPARPRRIHVDLRDTSDVWMRRSIKDKLSLNPVRPRTVFDGVELPGFLKALRRHSSDKTADRRSSRKNDKKHARHRSLKRRPRSRRDAPTPAGAAMPEPDIAVSTDPTVRFSEPLSPEQEQRAQPVRMPIPTHFTADGDSLQALAGQSNRVSVASADDEAQPPKVYQVLGRRNTGRSHKANQPSDAMSPVLVTIGRDGSIISDLASRPSDEQPSRSASVDAPTETVATERASAVPARTSQRAHSPSASPASVGLSTSQGTGSFVTARMALSSGLSEERAVRSPGLASVTEESCGVAEQQPVRRRQSDEVSDIAMRKHLLFGDDDSQSAMDPAFSEWLHAQAAEPRSSIAQAISQAPSLPLHPAFAAATVEMPQQRHFHPPPDSRSSQARYLGSEQSALLEGLFARVSALESQFTCMEAVMVNIEDKLSGTPSSPSRSLSIRRPGKARTAIGKTAVVKEIGGDETVEPNHRSPRTQTNPRSGGAVMQMASSDPALAAEAAASKLADIVGRSRLEFDAATSDALANIANMLNDIKALSSARAGSG